MSNPVVTPSVGAAADDALSPVLDDLAGVADRLASFPSTAGVQLAGFRNHASSSASSGFADTDAGVLLRDSTRFRPGSITKLLTATLVMQCVDDGLVALDDAIGPLLGLRLPASVLVRHVISHSSGIDAGDLFVDVGDDAPIETYARLVEDARLLFEPGTMFSYNNGGFVLAGLLVQRIRDASFEEVARARVFGPLGMQDSDFVSGRELLDRGANLADSDPPYAAGHLAAPGQLVRLPDEAVVSDPVCSHGLSPAGGTLVSTANDLLRLAVAHLPDSPSEVPPILSERSAAVMRGLHAPAPGGVAKMAGVGFGWQIWKHGDRTVPRIAGANPGQSGVVAIDPVAGSALVALTNSDQGVNLVTGMLDGFAPATAAVDDVPDDLSVYLGTYDSHAMSFVVDIDDSGLGMRVAAVADMRIGATQASSITTLGFDIETISAMRFPLTPVDRTTFASPLGPVAFLRDRTSDMPTWLRWRMRVLRRRDGD